MKKTLIIICFLTGCFYFYTAGYILLKAELSQYYIAKAWHNTLKDKNTHKPWPWADTYPVFEMEIPILNKKSYILQGQSGRNMAFSAVHLNSSGMPGTALSTIISGHNDSHFSYLKDVSKGDVIKINDKNDSFTYIVKTIEILNSKQDKLSIRNINELILITCYPFNGVFFGGDLRYVVTAVPKSHNI